MIMSEDVVEIDYTNWKGSRGQRTIRPISIIFNNSLWHPEPQWLLRALDIKKDAIRYFALKDVHGWKKSAPSQQDSPTLGHS
jgi:predicted DNA-binding transcriptional regulator YafY